MFLLKNFHLIGKHQRPTVRFLTGLKQMTFSLHANGTSVYRHMNPLCFVKDPHQVLPGQEGEKQCLGRGHQKGVQHTNSASCSKNTHTHTHPSSIGDTIASLY